MASPDGRPVFIPRVPWHETTSTSLPEVNASTDPVFVDPSGYFVNSEGEPLSEQDWDTHPDAA